MMACFPDFPLINGEWFPDTPWRKLDEEVQHELVRQVNSGPEHYWHSVPRHRLSIETFRFEKEVANGEWKIVPEPFRDEDINEIERGSFTINWNYPDSKIREAFAEWLSERSADREKRGLPHLKYKPKGRGGFRDQLNWLAGLRLIEGYNKAELLEDFGSRLKRTVPRPYQNYPELEEGAEKARRVLSSLSRHVR